MEDRFGKKLEEARTRQGISIREAADATKIRADYLLSFENNHGKFDMPDVYKRGFIRIYARFLHLEPREVEADFIAYAHGTSAPLPVPTPTPQLHGRFSLSGDPEEAEVSQATLPFDSPTHHQTFHTPSDPETRAREVKKSTASSNDESKALYWKIGLIFGGTLALFTILAIVISKFISHSPENTVASHSKPSIHESVQSQLNKNLLATTNATGDQITLTADGMVHVVVRQEDDKKRLFSGDLQDKKSITISRNGPVKVYFSNGSNLLIQTGKGEKVRPGTEGFGWTKI